MTYGIFLGYTFTPAWLAMTRAEREAFQAEHISPILAKYGSWLTIQHYDAEAFNVGTTDFAFITTEDMDAYYYFIEELRDSPLIAQGLAEFRTIHIGLADGYRQFARRSAAFAADLSAAVD